VAGATRAARSTRRDGHGRWLWRLVGLFRGATLRRHPRKECAYRQALQDPHYIADERTGIVRSPDHDGRSDRHQKRPMIPSDLVTHPRRHQPAKREPNGGANQSDHHFLPAHHFCPTLQMSHGRDWRDSWLCTRRDSPGCWLWRLVGLFHGGN
jgi:hypothetical protein